LQVALGLNHLHGQSIVHRDIAARFVGLFFFFFPAICVRPLSTDLRCC
jgi:serine/threonine protein kinase